MLLLFLTRPADFSHVMDEEFRSLGGIKSDSDASFKLEDLMFGRRDLSALHQKLTALVFFDGLSSASTPFLATERRFLGVEVAVGVIAEAISVSGSSRF
jgi:hypothetical protein